MIRTIYIVVVIVVIFSFVFVVIGETNNTFPQSDKVKEKHQESRAILKVATEALNMTDKMKYLCIQIDAKVELDKLEDKEQQEQCKKFLDRVSILELKELIDKYVKDN